jgi:hypothetical protein
VVGSVSKEVRWRKGLLSSAILIVMSITIAVVKLAIASNVLEKLMCHVLRIDVLGKDIFKHIPQI